MRKLSEPTDRLVLDLGREGNLDQALGAVSLEFEATMVRFYLQVYVSKILICT